MKKILCTAIAALALSVCVPFAGTQASAAEKLPDFTDDFESYTVDGSWIENNTQITEKWDNNVFRGGSALGMDSHIREVGKIEYENGTNENKVLHLKNTIGANTFFYMGPGGDYRVKNFTASFRLKFLVDDVPEKSWVGLSFRKKASSHYTGTNNLLFTVQREKAGNGVAGVGYAVFNGGEANPLGEIQSTYGEKLTIESEPYTVPSAQPEQDMPWITYSLKADGNHYTISVDGHTVYDCTFDIPSYDYYGFLSLNCCTSNILVDDFHLQIDDTELPPTIVPLATPVVRINEEKNRLEWDIIDGAREYVVDFGGEDNVKSVLTNFCSLEKLQPGTYTITVTAVPEDTFLMKSSEPSAPVTYTKAGAEEGKKGGCNSVVGGAVGAVGGLAALAVLIRRKRK